ncbi:MAG TPA: hypothetical protein VKB81_02090, partial [Nitrospira sp.]|nr:hypothetical protein [Nitrospira sp.]
GTEPPQRSTKMTGGIETFAWLVLAFADGPDCLLQASLHRLPEGPALVREDGCAVHSQQEGSYVVFWSDSRWVAIKIPDDARSLSYRWGRPVAFVNGKSVTVQHGHMGGLQTRPSLSPKIRMDPLDKWRIRNHPILPPPPRSSLPQSCC